MALRITHGTMYSAFNNRMNSTLADVMDANEKSTTQKRINRPSDDAVGAGRVLSYRSSLARMQGYDENIKTAKGWLNTADSVLSGEGSVLTVLTRLKTLAQQGATGTYDGSNREQMAFEIRQLFGQLINLSNSTYNGRYIFGGHKTDQPAYREGLAVTAHDPNLSSLTYNMEGGTAQTVIVQALESGAASDVSYRYSADGGKTWHDATVEPNLAPPYKPDSMRINAGGVGIVMDKNAVMTAVDIDNPNEKENGSWLYVRPTAIYQGDDHDMQVVTNYGNTRASSAEGKFLRDVTVRVDKVEDGQVRYAYSIDDGSTWYQATAPAGAKTSLPVMGGFLHLDGTPEAGEQFIIHPHRADLDLLISDNDTITVNMVGKDVFGGQYQYPSSGEDFPTTVPGKGNLFEVIGQLVAYAETNNQQGMQESLEKIQDVMQVISTQAAIVGGRENRLEVTEAALDLRMFETESSIRNIEDMDVAELMMLQARSQLAYNSVLKSSSMVMQLSLLNYL